MVRGLWQGDAMCFDAVWRPAQRTIDATADATTGAMMPCLRCECCRVVDAVWRLENAPIMPTALRPQMHPKVLVSGLS